MPRSSVYELWESFNDIAEGFWLTVAEFKEIVKSAIMEYLSVTERQLNFDTDAVFRLFDDDEVKHIHILVDYYHCVWFTSVLNHSMCTHHFCIPYRIS